MNSWDEAPAGLVVLDRDGTVQEVNATLLTWLGRMRGDVEQRRLSDFLSVGGRIFWETHLSPLLHVDGRVDEVALELVGAAGRLPVLFSAVAAPDGNVHASMSSARERARFEAELRAARAAAERSASRLEALQAVTAELSRAVGVDAVAAALLRAAVGPLGGGCASLWLVDGAEDLAPHSAVGEPLGEAHLPRSGAVLHEPGVLEVEGRVVVPLNGSTGLRGVLSLAARGGAGDDPVDVEVLTAVGQQAGLALDRATLYEQSATVARDLQHSLLAVDPPQDPRFAVATVYRPGVEMLEVGGDWYDVFLAEEGVLSVVVGDVVGRGLPAASAMGQLRSAVRAVAGPGVGPGRLLARLDRFVEQVEAAGMATIAYAEIELASGAVRYACAGHPPPLVLPAGGEPELLWEGRSTPLGAFGHSGEERAEGALQLAPGDRLLLFTDGLIERRDRGLDVGLELLRTAAGRLGDAALGDDVRTLTDQMLEDEQSRDDVCVLLLAWAGTSFERVLDADLSGLSAARRDLRTWLEERGVPADDAQDLVLATSEAVANAAEHGNGRVPGTHVVVRVRLEQRPAGGDEVLVQVRDAGRWRAPTVSVERGRGLNIIGALVDDVVVEAGPGTTVALRKRVVRVAS